MSFLYKTIGFMAVLGTVPASYAVTARPSIIGTASTRMPTMTAAISSNNTANGNSSTTSSTLLANAECIDAYTSCMKGAEACGPNFEECTTNVLFHGKMPQCLSTLAQCGSAGVQSLFGTSTVSALSNVKTKNSYGEVTEYSYPTDGSVLGQLITGAAISNRYDTSTCVKRYTSCLKKDSVCGSDFELCTTNTEFRKQRVYCDSTLARCQSEGLIELLGSATTTANPTATSRVGELIAEGAQLAAVNAVATCYKVVDQCFLNACANNPYKCYENSTQYIVSVIDSINKGDGIFAEDSASMVSELVSKAAVSGFIKNSCLATIGGNKYCYATFLGEGKMPTSSQLNDQDNQEEIYDAAYDARMNTSMKAKIADLIEDFDSDAKAKCLNTIKSCVMRSCGGGSGAACYSEVFGSGDKTINKSSVYSELKTGCSAVVNTDAYCKYAAANPNSTGTYTYNYINNSAFDTLFPEYNGKRSTDPIGAVASLNASLQNSYNDASIALMKRQCQAVASGCVRSFCGSDYQNCYRARTDVYSNLTNTNSASYNKSMNKVGGVLDYTIVLGLCLDTVKNASVCEEHLKIEQAKIKKNMSNATNSWGSATSVREGWIDAGGATNIEEGAGIQATDENGNPLCTAQPSNGTEGVCNVDMCGDKLCTEPVMISESTYIQSQAASTLFRDLVYDLEKEAQAKYNAKLTQEQHLCLSSNNGGILGKNDTGSTFMWVKLKGSRVPKNYTIDGLKDTQISPSNDLYGSFCRVRVTLQSDDKTIQEAIKGKSWATTYFAVGDSFSCGSWIPQKELEQLAQDAGKEARDRASMGNQRTKNWAAVIGSLGGAIGGGALGNSIANGKALSGLTGLNKSNDTKTNANTCVTNADRWLNAPNMTLDARSSYLTAALSAANKIKAKDDNDQNLSNLKTEISNVRTNMQTTQSSGVVTTDKCTVKTMTFEQADTKDITSTSNCRVVSVTDPMNGTVTTSMSCYDAAKAAGNVAAAAKAAAKAASSATSVENMKNAITGNSAAEVRVKNAITGNDANAAKKSAQNKANEIAGYTLTILSCDGSVSQNEMNGMLVNGTSVVSQSQIGNNVGTLTGYVQSLRDACDKFTDVETTSTKTKAAITAAGTVVGGVAGGVLAYQAVRNIQDAKLDSVQQAAYDEFMSEVGRHIVCYIGGDEVGSYNDIISTSLE